MILTSSLTRIPHAALGSFLLGGLLLAGCSGNSNNSNSTTSSTTTGGGSSNTTASSGETIKLTNVSYDPTRELYAEFDKAFSAYYQKQTGKTVDVTASHGGSGKQALGVVNGQPADVVTLALASDIDSIAKAGLLPQDWQKKLPQNSTPYTSTIVFLVRKGNPKGIKDWGDLIKSDVKVITPDPKVSGAARWAYLAAWGWALKQPGGSEAKAKAYIGALFNQHVPVLDTGSRAATNTFVKNGQGDVLLDWENEAILATKSSGGDQFQIVTPKLSILAEPPVAVVEKNATKNGTTEVAKAYLQYLYTPEGQDIVARHYYRPRDPKVAAKYASTFPKLTLWTLDSVFGNWTKAQATHFADGGTFDQIYKPGA